MWSTLIPSQLTEFLTQSLRQSPDRKLISYSFGDYLELLGIDKAVHID